MNQTTPKKPASRRGRKSKEAPTTADYCRLCGCCFKTQYGNFKTGWISSENLFVEPRRNGKTLPMLAKVIRVDLSLELEEGNSLSTRVCSPCGTKVRNCAALFSQIKEKFNKSSISLNNFTIATGHESTTGEDERMKRMSKSPHSSQNKKSARVSTCTEPARSFPTFPEQQPSQSESRARRSLVLSGSEDKENFLSDLTAVEHVPKRNRPAETSVFVDITYANSNKTAEYEGSEEGNLVQYIARQDWKAVVNILFKLKQVQNILPGAVQAAIYREFEVYCKSPNALKKSSPEEIENMSNAVIVEEVMSQCPIWFACARGACAKLSKPSDSKITNAIVLSTAILARCRNNKLSAVAHRISAILIHSGAKSSDFTRLNRLGICMSHDQTIKRQTKMGESHDAKILSWKQEVESRDQAKKLLSEVSEKQCQSNGEALVDVSKDTLQHYSTFTPKGFEKCATLMADKSTVPGQLSADEVTELLETEHSKERTSYR